MDLNAKWLMYFAMNASKAGLPTCTPKEKKKKKNKNKKKRIKREEDNYWGHKHQGHGLPSQGGTVL